MLLRASCPDAVLMLNRQLDVLGLEYAFLSYI